MLNVDLHSHSDQSDGVLRADELALRAHQNGVNIWALTDHDEISGLPLANKTALDLGITFINGVEISTIFCQKTIHIVGLNFDANNRNLLDALNSTRQMRDARASLVADKLSGLGVPDALQGALRYVSNPRLIGRVHFAKYLLEIGLCKNIQDAFDKYLGDNKKAFVPMQWLSLEQTINLILGAGGKAVIAHPARYKFTPQQSNAFFDVFKDLGGHAIEVITASNSQDHNKKYAKLALRYGFEASRGSDFHAPGVGQIDLGAMPNLPENLKPVWHDFS